MSGSYQFKLRDQRIGISPAALKRGPETPASRAATGGDLDPLLRRRCAGREWAQLGYTKSQCMGRAGAGPGW
ncbi:uncharacterized protein THITE_2085619 [Thermothielavioides terrestris NRRL 8126]|uniref:Uncharacterized protein n=1 Tax=Thermothielavioides terrestris (strain ATCC 38088 / NRRL 8126) TaxID=578455 RepID=G2QQV5_THETT|nr:uncharacterized protein THITE_2085619 [Thermothielavioides terrestris NRRL 8126]AEO64114.1 hypothetical protein THITE_2085619 [Thermothielavioides terrestris NRRL 8126]